jgi:hypothetical protein
MLVLTVLSSLNCLNYIVFLCLVSGHDNMLTVDGHLGNEEP